MMPVPADHEGPRTKSGPVRLPGIEDAVAAADRIAGQVRPSPLFPLAGEDDIRLKLEVLQPTGSFKVRGVFNWAFSLDPAEREASFLTFSAGNTALNASTKDRGRTACLVTGGNIGPARLAAILSAPSEDDKHR